MTLIPLCLQILSRTWLARRRYNFDVLPLVFSIDGKAPIYKEIPKEEVKEVPIEHPEYPISSLGVKWYGVPMISDMRLEIGGISYTAAPFNGWYMGTEIGARNLADHDRYNLLPAVAEMMDLDTSRNGTLWKDKALVELNVAVLHSFKNKESVLLTIILRRNNFSNLRSKKLLPVVL